MVMGTFYEYYISKYEITNEQYATFLNETAKVSSQDGLTDRYHESMRIDRQKINDELSIQLKMATNNIQLIMLTLEVLYVSAIG